MYNKIFSKILDSSIWLEPTPTRIVWLTFIAAMDEAGFVQFASVANVAHRAIVTLEEAQTAIDCLEGPDPQSADPEREGRRIERVPGGWIVLNAQKYRDLVSRIVAREQTRERVRKHRERRQSGNAPVTISNETVTPSEAEAEAEAEADTEADTEARSDRSFGDLDNQQHKNPTHSEPTVTTTTKPQKKKPHFSGQALTVHDWMHRECTQILGAFADDFDLGGWYWKLDERAYREGLVFSRGDSFEWLKAELVDEAQRRELPLKFATPRSGGNSSQWYRDTMARRRAGL